MLSTASPVAGVVPTALVRGTGYLFLKGSAHGVFHQAGDPDTGVAFVFQGSGRLSPLGQVHLSGTLHGTGFIRQGVAGGTLLLSNRRGSVRLSLEGPSQGGLSAPPSGAYRFRAEGGTGAYAHDLGTGTVGITLGARTLTLTFHGDPNRF